MESLSIWLSVFFGMITFTAVFIFAKASGWSKTGLIIILAWLGLQTIIGLSGFYTNTQTTPPRFLLLPALPLVLIAILFATNKGRKFIDSLDIRWLTLMHMIRIPVEITLFALFINKLIPVIMTFEGWNPDIISGITAPIIYYFVFIRNKLGRKWLIGWNLLCLAFLVNIVTIAILSAPIPFQRFAFDQPNIAVLYFPFVWLPCCVVPLVLFSHLAALRQLISAKKIVPVQQSSYA